MRDLNLTEIESVSGGFGFEDEDESRQDTVIVTGQRRMSQWEISQILDNLSSSALTGAALVDRIVSGAGQAAQDAVEQAEELEENCPGAIADYNAAVERLAEAERMYAWAVTFDMPESSRDEWADEVFETGAVAATMIERALAHANMNEAEERIEGCRGG